MGQWRKRSSKKCRLFTKIMMGSLVSFNSAGALRLNLMIVEGNTLVPDGALQVCRNLKLTYIFNIYILCKCLLSHYFGS